VGQRLHAIRRSDSGFTLTELLIVIVILGVLSGIVVFAVGAFTNRGELAACRADMKTVEAGAEAYRAQVGSYPTAITGGATPLTTLVGAGYLKGAPPTTDYVVTYTLVAGPPQTITVTGALVGGGAC
jgi:prepilin-type N-terminal cleavage/methylation domain-containing protein